MVFVQKWPFFEIFFLGKIGQENVFCDILEQKNAFEGYKNKKLKKSKNSRFSKGVNITETRPFKNVDRENANKWKMTLI